MSSGINRRHLLTAGAALAAAPAEARVIQGGMPWAPDTADAPRPAEPGPYQFFTPEEAAFIEAAVARLIPADDLGPGAKEAGVPTFIDRQLAGSYGRAETWYMLGPWHPGEPTQGYQSRLTPAQMYRYALKALDEHLRKQPSGKPFAELSTADQDSTLGDMETGKINLPGVSIQAFFEVLLQNTIEGFFADPLYGGNRDMVGWRLIGFPGARYDYRDFVAKHGQPFPLPPVSILGRPGWTPKT
jgi:gluconate 2-dehydrogenase gamma chain